MSDKSDNKQHLLEFDEQLRHGWDLEDFKQIAKTANGKRSESSAAKLKSLVLSKLRAKTDSSDNLREKLFRLNPSVTVIRQTSQYVQVSTAANLNLPKLPSGYGFKGGAARIAMLNILGINTRKLLPRDIDLVRIGATESSADNMLAARYMPDDFKYGHGVELSASLTDYFESRDFTVNELFLSGKKMTFSLKAFEDLKEGNIRLSDLYRTGRKELNGKLICKMLRLKTELESLGLNGSLELPLTLPEVTMSDYNFHLHRAKELDPELAERYKVLSERILPDLFSKTHVPTDRGSTVLNPRNELRRFRMLQKKHH